MPLFAQPALPDLRRAIFWDDFLTYAYNVAPWANLNLSSITTLTEVGGRVRLRADANVTGYLYHGAINGFRASKEMQIIVRCKMIPASGAGGLARVGFGLTMYWEYAPAASANFRCVCGYGGTTTVDSGVAGNNADHEFKIETLTDRALFYLDGVIKATITTNVTPDLTNPRLTVAGSAAAVSDLNVDYVWAQVTR